MDIRNSIRLLEQAEADQGKTITLTFQGDCDLLGLLKCLQQRGQEGSGTDIVVTWGGGEQKWYWDGDGRDRISSLD